MCPVEVFVDNNSVGFLTENNRVVYLPDPPTGLVLWQERTGWVTVQRCFDTNVSGYLNRSGDAIEVFIESYVGQIKGLRVATVYQVTVKRI